MEQFKLRKIEQIRGSQLPTPMGMAIHTDDDDKHQRNYREIRSPSSFRFLDHRLLNKAFFHVHNVLLCES